MFDLKCGRKRVCYIKKVRTFLTVLRYCAWLNKNRQHFDFSYLFTKKKHNTVMAIYHNQI